MRLPCRSNLATRVTANTLLCAIVDPLVAAYPNSAGYTVSMAVQSFGGPVVAERPLYFTFSGGTGGTDIIGFTGH